jgi:hypothetical protein
LWPQGRAGSIPAPGTCEFKDLRRGLLARKAVDEFLRPPSANDSPALRHVDRLEPTLSLRDFAGEVIVHRYLTSPTRLGQLQPENSTAEVHAIPCQVKELGLSEAAF